jgi:hypothetical protein
MEKPVFTFDARGWRIDIYASGRVKRTPHAFDNGGLIVVNRLPAFLKEIGWRDPMMAMG